MGIFTMWVCIGKVRDNVKDIYFLPLLSTTVMVSCFCFIPETLNTWRKMLPDYKFKHLGIVFLRLGEKR